jgi:hypothetical protein
MLANMIGFLDPTDTPERTELVTSLKDELGFMRSEYFSMLYGGPVRTVLEDAAPVYTTSSLFRSSAVSDLFFRTTDCLRADPSTCYETGEELRGMCTHTRLCLQQCGCGQAASHTESTRALLHRRSVGGV